MTEKDLSSIRKLELRKKHYIDLIHKLENEATLLSAPGLTPDKVQTSTDGHRMEAVVTDLLEARERLTRLIANTERQREYIVRQIHRLEDPRHVQILYEKYVNIDIASDFTVRDKSLDEIADHLGYSRAHTYRLYLDAVRAFCRLRKR